MKRVYSDINSTISIIPPGCTKYLQPLDATIINAFKRNCEKHRIEIERDFASKHTKSGNIKSIKSQEIIKIVSKGWKDVSSELIFKSFALPGTHGEENPKFFSHMPLMKSRYFKK